MHDGLDASDPLHLIEPEDADDDGSVASSMPEDETHVVVDEAMHQSLPRAHGNDDFRGEAVDSEEHEITTDLKVVDYQACQELISPEDTAITEKNKHSECAEALQRSPQRSRERPSRESHASAARAKHKDIGVSYMRARAMTSCYNSEFRRVFVTARTCDRTCDLMGMRDESEEHAGRLHLSNISDASQRQRQREVSAGTAWSQCAWQCQ